MTIDEALQRLKTTDACDSELCEALDMAIKALEQELCDDAISRQAVLEAFGLSEKSRKYGGDHSGYDTLMKYEIQDILEDLPPVTAQTKMGHWIKDKCSVCGEERAWYGQNPPYCPDCGSYNGGDTE